MLASIPSTNLNRQMQHYEGPFSKVVPVVREQEKGGEACNKKKIAAARKQSAKFRFITSARQRVGKTRSVPFSEQETFLLNTVTERWETGEPISRTEIYLVVSKQFEERIHYMPRHTLELTGDSSLQHG